MSVSTITGTGCAPGRLDVLGGVADYSGSHVLQMAIAHVTTVNIMTSTTDYSITCSSVGRESVTITWNDIVPHLKHSSLQHVCMSFRTYLKSTSHPHWCYYVLGSVVAFCYVMSWKPSYGMNLTITSDVPEGMGVSSSAAIEVATLRACEDLASKMGNTNIRFTGTTLAHTAQSVENHVAGAPCGLMDQLASAYGQTGALLPIMCRPDTLYPLVKLPKGICVVGWCSGVKHSNVGASPYAVARCASFMGKAIISHHLKTNYIHTTEIVPSSFATYAHMIPERMNGADFIKKYGNVSDPQSTIDPNITYPIRAAVSFPIHENHRVQVVTSLLRTCTEQEQHSILILVGELLLQSHAGYSAMGLGCATTDVMVQRLMTEGPSKGIYGARISGGGSGGTVVVLCHVNAIPTVDKLRLELPSSHKLPLIR